MIDNSNFVEDYFGYWPDFADGKIKRFSIEQKSLTFEISYVDASLDKAALVAITFEGVSDIDMNDLRSENVIDILKISFGVERKVVLDACYGLAGSFNFMTARVASLTPSVSR